MLKNLFNRKKKRREALESLAQKMGLPFTAKDEYGLKTLLKDFRLAKRGHSHRVRNMIEHKDDELEMDLRFFDYHYVVQAGNNTVPVSHSVFFVRSKKLQLPEFLMIPENFFHKIAQYLGREDIDFEQFPEFSDQYLLKGEDESRIRQQMNDEMLHFFTIEKDWCLEGLNYFLVFYTKKRLLPPEQIQSFYQKGLEIYRMLIAEENE